MQGVPVEMRISFLDRRIGYAGLTILAVLSGARIAVAQVSLGSVGPEYPLSSHVEILRDPTKALDIEAVRRPDCRDRFEKNNARVPSFGYTDAAFWVRFSLDNSTDAAIRKILELAYPTVNELDVYIDDGSGKIRHVASGMARPFSSRDYDYHNFLFDIEAPANRVTTVFLRFFSLSSSLIPLVLWDGDALIAHITRNQYVLGMMAGAFVLLIIYNGFLYFPLKDRTYLYYILFLISSLLYHLSVKGFAYQMLWPGSYFWGDRSLAFFVYTTCAAGFLFTLKMLDLKRTSPRMSLVFRLFAIVCGLCAAGVFVMDYARVVYFSTILGGVATSFVLGSAVYFYLKKIPHSGQYLLGWLLLVVGAILAALKFLGVLPATFVTDYGLQIGSVFEISLFSVALADRINTLKWGLITEEQRRIAFEEKNALLKKTNRIIRDAYDQIESSLDYAMRTQKALVPNLFNPVLSSFAPLLLWQERDKVGGDLPIWEETRNGIYFGVVDCTGHGVPGAFITMTVSSCLKRILHDEALEMPGEVLGRLNVMLKHSLNKDRVKTENDDGLDMALCYRQKEENCVRYAGARLPLYVATNPREPLSKIKPGKQSLGYLYCSNTFVYETHTVPIRPGMRLFMWTDGFTDQVGGQRGLPFGGTRLMSLLEKNADKAVESIGPVLLKAFHDWRGDLPVQDDITILGVEF